LTSTGNQLLAHGTELHGLVLLNKELVRWRRYRRRHTDFPVASRVYRPHPKRKYFLQPGQQVTLRLPGGGGFYPPWERDPQMVLEDVRQGLVSLEAAAREYGVVIDPEDWVVDEEATAQRREAIRGKNSQ
jgi:N-methylhydantoinase B/oxoprolinase/acetone carboxylase alpha subunit